MIWNQDPELMLWVENASTYGGSFVHEIAEAALFADHENYALMRPLLLNLKIKYPAYGKEKNGK